MKPPTLTAASLTEILERTIIIYRANFLQFLGLAALVNVPVLLISTPLSIQYQQELTAAVQSGRVPESFWSWLIVSVIGALLQGVIVGGVMTFIASEHVFGKKLTVFEALTAARERLVPLAVGLSAFGGLMGVLFVATLLLLVFCPLLIVAFGFTMYIGFAAFFFLIPILTLENISAADGLRRAWGLGKARFWPALRLLVAIAAIAFAINLVLAIVIGALASPSGGGMTGGQVVGLFVSILVQLALTPLQPVALTLMYYDTRVRLEGLDSALASVNKPDARPYDIASPMTHNVQFTQQDVRNVFTLLGLMLILYFVLAFFVLAPLSAAAWS